MPVTSLGGDALQDFAIDSEFAASQPDLELKEVKAWVGGVLNKFVETVVGPPGSDENEAPAQDTPGNETETSAADQPCGREGSGQARGLGTPKRLSTLNALGNAANGGFASLGRRWTAVTESDTFKNSRLAAANLVDAVAESLGSLEPGDASDDRAPPGDEAVQARSRVALTRSPRAPLPDLPLGGVGSLAYWSRAAPKSVQMHNMSSKKRSGAAHFDAFDHEALDPCPERHVPE